MWAGDSHDEGNEIVKLNIGGYRYMTTRGTLTRNGTEDNFFSSLLSAKFKCCKDEKGYYFIDRNGKYFEPILDYLRTGVWMLDHQPANTCCKTPKWNEKIILEEARFYSIEPNVYTSVTDSSLLELFNKSQEEEGEEVYDKHRRVLDQAKEIIMKTFLKAASERGRNPSDPIRSPIFLPTVQEINTYFPKHQMQEELEKAEKDTENFVFLSRDIIDFNQVLVQHLKLHNSLTVHAIVSGTGPQVFHPKNFESSLQLEDVIQVVFEWQPFS